jgi:hypothetical protein
VRKREGNRPDRRLVPAGTYTKGQLDELARRLTYAGSGLHKRHPGNYGFIPSINPRPSKSVCDDLRMVTLGEAAQLLAAGIAAEMVSPFDPGGSPKYVWAVDGDGQVYEAKTKPPDTVYHGYRLGDDEEAMRRYISGEWEKRCPRN